MTAPLPEEIGEVASAARLGGGDVATAWRVTTTDGRRLVVKQPPYDATLEAEGLRALDGAGAPVPSVLHASAELLVMTEVQGRPDWHRLGATLAEVHTTTAATFGWHRDNVIGPLPQQNAAMQEWGAFYAERRVRAWLDAPALPTAVRRRLEAACEGPLPALVDHDTAPSLVHGDLWSGNVVDGSWLIDPAVHYADRELDLAFATLFGGIPAAFFSGYEAAWPLDRGWRQRRPALQLHHLLVHVRLFGAGYVPAVTARLDTLGW